MVALGLSFGCPAFLFELSALPLLELVEVTDAPLTVAWLAGDAEVTAGVSPSHALGNDVLYGGITEAEGATAEAARDYPSVGEQLPLEVAGLILRGS